MDSLKLTPGQTVPVLPWDQSHLYAEHCQSTGLGYKLHHTDRKVLYWQTTDRQCILRHTCIVFHMVHYHLTNQLDCYICNHTHSKRNALAAGPTPRQIQAHHDHIQDNAQAIWQMNANCLLWSIIRHIYRCCSMDQDSSGLQVVLRYGK